MPRIRRFDDVFSDPDMIAAKYRAGQSAYFECELALGELSGYSPGGSSIAVSGTAGNPDITPIFFPPTCPEADQYVWIDEKRVVRAGSLVGEKVNLFNPITGRYSKLVKATLHKNQELRKITTAKGIESVVSHSHKIIRNSADKRGISLKRCGSGGEILSFDEWHSTSDILLDISDAGCGDVVEIEMAAGFIYACGTSTTRGICSHNRKADDEIFPII